MVDAFSVDDSELRALAADLGRVAGRVVPGVDAVVKRGAQNIKNELVEDAAASAHFKQVARTISYDSDYRIGQVAYEIGPDRDRAPAARIANIAYFGGVNGGGGTLDLDKPGRNEEPRMMKALDEFLGGLL